jgi:hypothetical protein
LASAQVLELFYRPGIDELALRAGKTFEARVALYVFGDGMERGGVDAVDLKGQEVTVVRRDTEDVAFLARGDGEIYSVQ